ncbi:MAG: AAA family ATPase [Sedimentisphaerales bacterium]|nr:AAA family ATPase [Sedimentisphaerales bacterium]
MITKLSVANFKSIRRLDIECKKINVFIGEPNTGKSNILEALGLLSWCGQSGEKTLSDYVRFDERIQFLYFKGLVDRSIEIRIATEEIDPTGIHVSLNVDQFEIASWESNRPDWVLDKYGTYTGSFSFGPTRQVKFFRFKDLKRFDSDDPGSLRPPSGTNLIAVVTGSELLRSTVAEFFLKYGYKIRMKRYEEKAIEIQEDDHGDPIIFPIPYALTSDTLRRIIFYTVAIMSNRDSVLVFEEPESNAFPYYTKYLGERIAGDETNQFFIATHNPYLLSAVIEKGRKEDVQVFITYFKDYQTKVKPLTPDEVVQLMEADPFFNLDRFIEGAQ